jgi:hypothetical protein
VTTAKDFERLPPDAGRGTSKLFARSDLWAAPDPERAYSEGDFVGRLITLFGKPDADGGFVLRHAPSGLVVTAYSAANGPTYGGFARALASMQHTRADLEKMKDEWAALDVKLVASLGTGELPSLDMLESRKALWRRLAEMSAPEGYADVVEALEGILEETPLADYERIDDTGDLGPHRVGVRDGKPFVEKL